MNNDIILLNQGNDSMVGGTGEESIEIYGEEYTTDIGDKSDNIGSGTSDDSIIGGTGYD